MGDSISFGAQLHTGERTSEPISGSPIKKPEVTLGPFNIDDPVLGFFGVASFVRCLVDELEEWRALIIRGERIFFCYARFSARD